MKRLRRPQRIRKSKPYHFPPLDDSDHAAMNIREREVNFYGGGDSYTYKKTVGKDAIPTPDEVAHMKIGDIRMHVYDGGHQFWVLTTVPASDPPRLAWTAAQQGMAHPTRGRGYCLVLKQDKKPAWLKSDTAKTYKQRTAREAKKNASPKGPADAGGGNPPGGMGSGGNERRAKKRV